MALVEKMDEYGRPAWVAAMVLGFWVYWPVGLVILAYLLCTGRLRGVGPNGPGRWHNAPGGWSGCGWNRSRAAAPSGNAAFDEYRAETLRRLEEEQREFVEYLERLRRARDKAEFEQFMAERRNRPSTPPAPDQPDAG